MNMVFIPNEFTLSLFNKLSFESRSKALSFMMRLLREEDKVAFRECACELFGEDAVKGSDINL